MTEGERGNPDFGRSTKIMQVMGFPSLLDSRKPFHDGECSKYSGPHEYGPSNLKM